MPELPEVEVCRRGLQPVLVGKPILAATIRFPRLRRDLPPDLATQLAGRVIVDIRRRGKYLLFDCSMASDPGWLLLHLGMSGHLRFVPPDEAPGKHDHFDLQFPDLLLRFSDPRRFGLIDWHAGPAVENHPQLAGLGIEPLSDTFNGAWLYRITRNRRAPVKALLMDARHIVGIGNIYAAESLFLAGISPLRPAGKLSMAECTCLINAVRETLAAAIAAGGSTIRNYLHSDGSQGYFQLSCAVYGRAGEVCRHCGSPIQLVRQSGRSSFFCPVCQK